MMSTRVNGCWPSGQRRVCPFSAPAPHLPTYPSLHPPLPGDHGCWVTFIAHLLCPRPCFKPFCALTHIILTRTLWILFVSHFADEKPETPGVGSLALSYPAQEGQRQDLNLEPWLQSLLPAAELPLWSLTIDPPPFHPPTHIPAQPAGCAPGSASRGAANIHRARSLLSRSSPHGEEATTHGSLTLINVTKVLSGWVLGAWGGTVAAAWAGAGLQGSPAELRSRGKGDGRTLSGGQQGTFQTRGCSVQRC